VGEVPLADVAVLAPMLERISEALTADDQKALSRAVNAAAHEMLRQWQAAPLAIRVLARRPSDENAELHGLYVREEDGSAVIRVWMRTAAHEQPVKFRTFVRTLVHELMHHLDFDKLKFEDSFHTEGFYRRESAVVRQLLGQGRPSTRAAPPDREQLSLFKKPKG
jgi:hypothetical protein